MILLFTPSIAIGTQQPHNSSNTEHNPVILNRHSISLPILRLLFNLLLLLKQRQPHFFGWERCCGQPQHYFSHSLIIRSSSIYSVSQLFFALIFDSDLATDFQIPLVRSLCDSVYLVRSLCHSLCILLRSLCDSLCSPLMSSLCSLCCSRLCSLCLS
jgi:hypothetical protein